MPAATHHCWVGSDASDFRRQAARFLGEGAVRGEQLLFVGEAPADVVRSELAEVPGLADLLAAGALLVASVADTYGTGAVVDPDAQVAAYARATEAALAAGHTGLRVAAEASPLVATAAQLDAFCRYEQLVNRYVLEAPFTALCGYRVDRLGDDAVAELACVHHGATPGATAFALTATGDGWALAGEVDATVRAVLDRALGRTGWGGGTFDVDVRGLEFVDHDGLVALDRFAGEHGGTAVLHGARPIVVRVAGILELGNVEVLAA